MATYIGIEIGGTKLQIVSGDRNARITERFQFSVEPAAGASGIRQQIEETIRKIIATQKINVIGVGFGS